MAHKTSLTPGVVELEKSTLHETKENIRLDQLIPADILHDRNKLRQFLEAYYAFMNMDEFIYQETETFNDVVLSNIARFRIPDPNNENNRFFTDETGANSTLVVTSPAGVSTTIPLDDINVAITNGNELPGSLVGSTSEIGKTFAVNGLNLYNGYTATLTTIVKYWVGPGPSWVMNNIEKAMDIDRNETNYLELMQKEIAAAIPRDVTVNKRNLYKRIIDFYKLRGSADSIEIFFRLLFNESVEVEFPYNETLIPSSGDWDQPAAVSATVNGAVTNSSTVTISAANENIRLSSKLVVSGLYTKVDDIRVDGISGTTITLSSPRATEIEASGSGIIDLVNDTILLETIDSPKYSVGTKLTYRVPAGGTAIGGLADGNDYYVVSNESNKIKLSSTSGGSAIDLDDLGVLGSNNNAKHTFTFSINLLDGAAIEFVPRGTFLDNKGFLSYNIKLQDSLRYQKFSYIIKTGKNLSDWENVYDKLVHPAGFVYFAEILIFLELVDSTLTAALNKASMPQKQPGVIGPEDIPLLVEMFASTFLPGVQAKIHKSGTLSLSLKDGVISSTTITDGGSGYIAPPVVTSADSGTPSGITKTAILTSTIAAGEVSGITITDGGEDYNIPTLTIAPPTRIVFDGSDFGFGQTVDGVSDQITLQAAEVSALPIGSVVTYDSGSDSAIGGLVTGKQYRILTTPTSTSIQLEDHILNPGFAIQFGFAGGGTDHGFTGETATATASKTDGELKSVSIVEPGFGYTSAPAITFNGIEQSSGSGVSPSVTIGIDSDGRLDVDNITINSSGGGWTALFGTPAANPNAGSIAKLNIFGKADKNYISAPNVVFPQPESKDINGNPLGSNVTATAVLTLDSDGEITGFTITNAGNGYINDPIVKLGSAVQNETRVADQQEILILSLNHEMYNPYNGFNYANFQTIANNDSFQRKGTNNFFSSPRIYNTNQTIEFLGSNQIQTIDSTLINKYNTRTFVHIE